MYVHEYGLHKSRNISIQDSICAEYLTSVTLRLVHAARSSFGEASIDEMVSVLCSLSGLLQEDVFVSYELSRLAKLKKNVFYDGSAEIFFGLRFFLQNHRHSLIPITDSIWWFTAYSDQTEQNLITYMLESINVRLQQAWERKPVTNRVGATDISDIALSSVSIVGDHNRGDHSPPSVSLDDVLIVRWSEDEGEYAQTDEQETGKLDAA